MSGPKDDAIDWGYHNFINHRVALSEESEILGGGISLDRTVHFCLVSRSVRVSVLTDVI